MPKKDQNENYSLWWYDMKKISPQMDNLHSEKEVKSESNIKAYFKINVSYLAIGEKLLPYSNHQM